jgi:hypothetical protein
MFPVATENWNTSTNQPHAHKPEIISKPVIQPMGESVHQQHSSPQGSDKHFEANALPRRENFSQQPDSMNGDVKQYMASNHTQQKDNSETVDDIVSQISIKNTHAHSLHKNEKEEEGGLKGFFGLIGGTKKASDKKEDENRHIEIKDTRSNNGGSENNAQQKSKDDDSFEIPAFLRRSLY